MSVVLYSTGCPRCKSLKFKLDKANIPYDLVSDVEEIQSLGFKSAPVLKVNDSFYGFSDAIAKFNEIMSLAKES